MLYYSYITISGLLSLFTQKQKFPDYLFIKTRWEMLNIACRWWTSVVVRL